MRSQIAAGTIAYALASTVCRLHVAHILLRLLRGCRDVDMPIQSLDLHIDPEDRQIHPLPERWTLSLLRLNGCSGTLCQFIKALNETFAAMNGGIYDRITGLKIGLSETGTRSEASSQQARQGLSILHVIRDIKCMPCHKLDGSVIANSCTVGGCAQ